MTGGDLSHYMHLPLEHKRLYTNLSHMQQSSKRPVDKGCTINLKITEIAI